MPVEIHPTALVHKDARLADGVRIGPYAIVDGGVTVGEGTEVGPRAYLTGRTTIGRKNRIFSGAVVGSEPQDVKYHGEETTLVIGDGNIIREYATLNPGTGEGSRTVVGDGNWLMMNVHVAHNCVIGNHCKLANVATLAGHVRVDDYAILGGITAVHQFVRIGRYSMVGGGLRVPMDVAPYVMAGGEPLAVHGLNGVGLERNGFTPERIKILKDAYKVVFRKNLTLKDALQALRADLPANEDMAYLIEFLEGSTRGITR
jgi:UDP-N-acetylglucosamine acyltransferase